MLLDFVDLQGIADHTDQMHYSIEKIVQQLLEKSPFHSSERCCDQSDIPISIFVLSNSSTDTLYD